MRIKKPSAEVKIQNLVNYSAVYCRNGKGPTILNIEYSVHFPLLLDIIYFYTSLPLNFEPATWVENDLQVGKCTSKGVAGCTPLMGWNILTLCKTRPLVYFYTSLPLNFEPATWVENDFQVGKCTSKGVAGCTPLMGWNILTLCKTFQQHIHVTSKSTHPSFPVHKFR